MKIERNVNKIGTSAYFIVPKDYCRLMDIKAGESKITFEDFKEEDGEVYLKVKKCISPQD